MTNIKASIEVDGIGCKVFPIEESKLWLGISKRTAYRWLKKGDANGVKIGGRTFIILFYER